MVFPGRLNDNTKKFFCYGCGWIMFVDQFNGRIGLGSDDPVRRNNRIRNPGQLARHLRMMSLQMNKSLVCQSNYSALIVFKTLHLLRFQGPSRPLQLIFIILSHNIVKNQTGQTKLFPSAKTISARNFLVVGLTALFFSVIVNYHFYSS